MRRLIFILLVAGAVHASQPCPQMGEGNTYINFLGTRSGCTVVTSTLCQAGEPIQFAVGGFRYDFRCAPHQFQWSFGDGTTGSGQQTTHMYSQHGIYRVAVKISNASQTHVLERVLSTANIGERWPFLTVRLGLTRTWRFLIVGAEGEGGWMWDFGDGTKLMTSRLETDHEYTRGGQFLVRLSSMKGTKMYTQWIDVPAPKQRAIRR